MIDFDDDDPNSDDDEDKDYVTNDDEFNGDWEKMNKISLVQPRQVITFPSPMHMGF